ncbi:flagellar hook-associated protein FlgL [Salinisphaera sp. SPP-AMP-43]|uniref:flagellar hook-associated protein FlgL n=1 Tax=Salinisphaera sp. SPP-AMP-43 TaxID=3121288 RepID=UPI003C6E20B3
MRLSTNTIYSIGTQSILDQQSRVSKLGEQLSTGQRINNPSDDPRGAAQLLNLQQSSQINEQYASNRATAQRQMSTEEDQLNQVTDALASAGQRLVQAANGTLGDADRESLANQLEGVYDQLVSNANAKDGNGRYIFAGFKSDTAPFSGSTGALSFTGDNGQRQLQVDGSRQMAINDTGDKVFTSTTSNASYVATAAADNSGSATYSALDIADASADDYGRQFTLSFAVDGSGNTTYTVDGPNGTSDPQAYQPGEPIALGDSMQTKIKGAPADGDSFTFAKDRGEDNNILNALAQTVSTLREPVNDDRSQAKLTNTINRAMRQVNNAQDNVLSVRSNLGTRLNELDNLDDVGQTMSTNYERNISSLRDADMVSTISDWSLARVALQASQQTFTSIQQMSIFQQT